MNNKQRSYTRKGYYISRGRERVNVNGLWRARITRHKRENEIENLKSEVYDIQTEIRNLLTNMDKFMAKMMKEV